MAHKRRGEPWERGRQQRSHEQVKAQTRGQATDARSGASHLRTAAGPPAAPKLDKRTFLVDHFSISLRHTPSDRVYVDDQDS